MEMNRCTGEYRGLSITPAPLAGRAILMHPGVVVAVEAAAVLGTTAPLSPTVGLTGDDVTRKIVAAADPENMQRPGLPLLVQV